MSLTKPELKLSWETRSCIVRSTIISRDKENEWECGVFHTWELGKEKVNAIVELWNGVHRIDPEDVIFTDEDAEMLSNVHNIQKSHPEEFRKFFRRYFEDGAQK